MKRGRRPTIKRGYTTFEDRCAQQIIVAIKAEPGRRIFRQASVAAKAGLTPTQVGNVNTRAMEIVDDESTSAGILDRLVVVQERTGYWYIITSDDAPMLYRAPFKSIRTAHTALERAKHSLPVGTTVTGRSMHTMLIGMINASQTLLLSMETMIEAQESLDV